MYSRQSRRELHIQPNYGGSVFDRKSAALSTPVEDLTLHRQSEHPPRTYSIPQNDYEQYEQEEEAHQDCACCECEHTPTKKCEKEADEKKKSAPLLSPIGELGTEEILLIAIALIIFQSGNDPELSLILLALLFIN